MTECVTCSSRLSYLTPVFHCVSGEHYFCQNCLPQENSCLSCTKEENESNPFLGKSHGFPPKLNGTRDVGNGETGLAIFIQNPVQKDEMFESIQKKDCKYRRYGCRKHLSIHNYEHHIHNCSFRPSCCPRCDITVPMTVDSMDAPFNFMEEINFKDSISSTSTLTNTPDNKTGKVIDFSNHYSLRDLLTGDSDPWLGLCKDEPTDNIISYKFYSTKQLSRRLIQFCDEPYH